MANTLSNDTSAWFIALYAACCNVSSCSEVWDRISSSSEKHGHGPSVDISPEAFRSCYPCKIQNWLHGGLHFQVYNLLSAFYNNWLHPSPLPYHIHFIVVTAIYLKIFPWNKSGFFGGYNTAFYYFFSAFIYFIYMIPVCYLLQTAVFSLDIAYVGNMKRIQYPAGRQFLFPTLYR